MKAHLFKRRKQNELSERWFTSLWVQGEGLSERIPINVVFFGKPVMEPVMVKAIDPTSGKVRLDKDGKEIFVEQKDKAGNVVLQEKKDENGEVVLRDEEYAVRVSVLEMYAADVRSNELCKPVEVIAKKRSKPAENGDTYNYFIVVEGMEIPIEVVDFTTDTRQDYNYRSNCVRLTLIATKV